MGAGIGIGIGVGVGVGVGVGIGVSNASSSPSASAEPDPPAESPDTQPDGGVEPSSNSEPDFNDVKPFQQRLEEAVAQALGSGELTIEAWELVNLEKKAMSDNKDPRLGPEQERWQAEYYDEATGESRYVSVNYDPATGEFTAKKSCFDPYY